MIEKVISYELKRAIARKKVVSLVAITLLFEVGIYVLLSQVRSQAVEQVLSPFKPLLWVIGVLLPQSLLLHFIAISISSGSMSEEYEQGTVDFFLTKPITRLQFALGKFVGGFFLVVLIYLLMESLALFLSVTLFGRQLYISYVPLLTVIVIFSSITFYSIGFVAGEVLRRSSLAFLVSSSILIGSILIGGVLVFVGRLTGSGLYTEIALAMPSWGATQLPFMYAQSIPNSYLLLQVVEIFPPIPGTALIGAIYTASYSVAAVVIAMLSFWRRDIPKRVT